MDANLPKLISVVYLSEAARLYGNSVIGDSMHQSLPIPLVSGVTVRLAFLYGRAEITTPRDGFKLWPPTYISEFHALSGKLERLRKLNPTEMGLPRIEDEPLGRYLSPAERLTDELLTTRAQCQQGYDRVLPHFVADSRPAVGLLRDEITAFLKVFGQLREEPWLPCYRTMGRQFFQWLDDFAALA